ncbi:MAG: dihydroorotase [Thaumarchaeota archaeon]|nr:dihydroorotase [Nitrososphaerota archaeon]
MEHDLVIQGTVVDREGLRSLEVGVSGGIISEVKRQGVKGARRIRAERSLIFPGFIDIHVHMREPGWEYKEDFRTGSLAALHGGVTTVVDMPNNPVPTTTRSALDEKRRLAEAKSLVDVKFYFGVLGENLKDLANVVDRVSGYKIYLSKTTGSDAFPESELGHAFEQIAGTGRPVSLHCEEQSVIDKMQIELDGVSRPDVHCDLRPPEAEVESVKKVVAALSRVHDLDANVCHASAGETISIVRKARAGGVRLHCEAALHHLYFNRKAMLENRMLKTNPPLRREEDRKALLGGVVDGTVSFLVTDHAPHTMDEKTSLGLSGVPGLDDYGHVVSWLAAEQNVDPLVIARLTSSNPARFAKLGDRGEISVGKRADITIVDLHSPEKVRSDSVRSKCGWSPYEGKEFPGRVRWTIRGGEPLMDDFELSK